MVVEAALINAVLNWFYTGATIGAISRICLNDGTNDRDCSTSLTFSQPSAWKLRVTTSISVTATYTVTRVTVYSGTTRYATTSLAQGISVVSGDTVNVTWDLDILTYCSVSAIFTSCDINAIRDHVFSRLRGGTGTLAPPGAIQYFSGEYEWDTTSCFDIIGQSTISKSLSTKSWNHALISLYPGGSNILSWACLCGSTANVTLPYMVCVNSPPSVRANICPGGEAIKFLGGNVSITTGHKISASGSFDVSEAVA